MKIYRQVSTIERLPDKEGDYITEEGILKFRDGKFWWDYSKTSDWGTDKPYDVDFWMEEVISERKRETDATLEAMKRMFNPKF